MDNGSKCNCIVVILLSLVLPNILYSIFDFIRITELTLFFIATKPIQKRNTG